MSKHLKECPFCDSDDVGVEYDGSWEVVCGNCGFGGPVSEISAIEAEDGWNRLVEDLQPKIAEADKWVG
jgi:transcription initiation factor TFIIIB Brf1 subunit/transcription initiation factor TFIIB